MDRSRPCSTTRSSAPLMQLLSTLGNRRLSRVACIRTRKSTSFFCLICDRLVAESVAKFATAMLRCSPALWTCQTPAVRTSPFRVVPRLAGGPRAREGARHVDDP